MSLSIGASQKKTGMDSLVLTNSLNLGPFFCKDLFCDAFFTKDNIALIPIHRNIMAGVSSRFRAMFEEDLDCKVFVVPLVDYDTLKKIVKYIYCGSVSFEKKEELEDFRIALDILKLEVPGAKVGAPSSVEGPKGTGTDEDLSRRPFKEMKEEDLIQNEQGDLVKEKQQESSKEQEDSDSKEQEAGEGTSSSMDSGERDKLKSSKRSPSRGHLSSQENILSSTRSSSPSPPRRSSPLARSSPGRKFGRNPSAVRSSLCRKPPRRPSHPTRTAPSMSPSPPRKLPIPRRPPLSRSSSPPSSRSSRCNRSPNCRRRSPSRQLQRKSSHRRSHQSSKGSSSHRRLEHSSRLLSSHRRRGSVSLSSSSPSSRKSSPLRKHSSGAGRYERLSKLCSFFVRGCCTYGNICKNPHSAKDLVESEVFKIQTLKGRYVAFFVDQSGAVTVEDLEDVFVASARTGQEIRVDRQERGFGHPGVMFKVTVTTNCIQGQLQRMLFNLETLLVKGVELKKPAWTNMNKGRKDGSDQASWFDRARIDLRDKIRNKQLGGEVDPSLNNGVKKEQEEWQENLDQSRKRVKVEVKAEVKEEVDDGKILNLKQEGGN